MFRAGKRSAQASAHLVPQDGFLWLFAIYIILAWANRSAHGVGKWFAKFRTGKFRPGIAFRDRLYESVPFTGKRRRRSETGIKDYQSFEEM